MNGERFTEGSPDIPDIPDPEIVDSDNERNLTDQVLRRTVKPPLDAPKPAPPKGRPRQRARSVETQRPTKDLGVHAQALADGNPEALSDYVEKELLERPDNKDREIVDTPQSSEIAEILMANYGGQKFGIADIVVWVFGKYSLHPQNFGELRLRLAELSDQGVVSMSKDEPNSYGIISNTAGGTRVPYDDSELELKLRAAKLVDNHPKRRYRRR